MLSLRKWATPLTVASFLIMGVTGILMFFHLESGLNVPLHKWAGWLMVVGVLGHLILNWRPFTIYLKRPLARVVMGLGAALLVLSFLPVSGNSHPAQQVMRAMARADLSTVIALSGQDLNTGLEQLAAVGLTANETTTVAELTGGDRERQMQLIQVLFAD